MEWDAEYYHHRAEKELALAQSADSPDAIRSRYILAAFYLDQAYHCSNDRCMTPDTAQPITRVEI